MTIDKLKPGMIVYDVHSYRMGNTTLRSVGVWGVVIVSVDTAKNRVVARWNSNEEEIYYHASWSKWRAKPPTLVRNAMGMARLATRQELAEMKSKAVP